MAFQTISATPRIEWDDTVVFVFSFNNFFCGFVHMQVQLAITVGSQVQISSIIQQVNQQGVQFAADPQSWIDTIKNAARGGSQITIVFDDAISTNYTTPTGRNFTLQQLFSVSG